MKLGLNGSWWQNSSYVIRVEPDILRTYSIFPLRVLVNIERWALYAAFGYFGSKFVDLPDGDY